KARLGAPESAGQFTVASPSSRDLHAVRLASFVAADMRSQERRAMTDAGELDDCLTLPRRLEAKKTSACSSSRRTTRRSSICGADARRPLRCNHYLRPILVLVVQAMLAVLLRHRAPLD